MYIDYEIGYHVEGILSFFLKGVTKATDSELNSFISFFFNTPKKQVICCKIECRVVQDFKEHSMCAD